MRWKNNDSQFGFITILLHWLVPIPVFALFALGWWMTELDYYDSWYKTAPWWHKSIGILLFITVSLRMLWRFLSPIPNPLNNHKPWEIKTAHLVHLLLYILLFTTMLSGYLISTADNRAIDVFNWFSIPATITSIPDQEDIAGQIHFILASILIGLAGLHIAAALKHHFIDKDQSINRMLGR